MIKSKEWLIENRKIKGLTQLQLADLTGIKVGTIQNIEQGKRVGSENVWDILNNFFKGLLPEVITIDNRKLIANIEDLINLKGKNEEVYLLYTFKNGRLMFTSFYMEEVFKKSKIDRYMKTTVSEAKEIFVYQSKVF